MTATDVLELARSPLVVKALAVFAVVGFGIETVYYHRVWKDPPLSPRAKRAWFWLRMCIAVLGVALLAAAFVVGMQKHDRTKKAMRDASALREQKHGASVFHTKIIIV